MIAAQQAREFLTMVVCGAMCACMHDTARMLGWMLGGRKIFSSVMDLLLGVVFAAGMTGAGLYLGVSPMRLYLFAGMGLGAALWYGTGGAAGRRLGAVLRKRCKKE